MSSPASMTAHGVQQQRPKIMLPAQVFQPASAAPAARMVWQSPSVAYATPKGGAITTPMGVASSAYRLETCPGAPQRRGSHDTPTESPMTGCSGPVHPTALWPRSVGGTPLAADGTPMSGVMFPHTASQRLRRGSLTWASPASTPIGLNTAFIGTPTAMDMSPHSQFGPFSADVTPIARSCSKQSVYCDRFAASALSAIEEVAHARTLSATGDDAPMTM